MKKIATKLAVLGAVLSLAGCYTNPPSQTMQSTWVKPANKTVRTSEKTTETTTVAKKGMDENDRSKLFHALDKAPGKSTHWVNANTGTTYTVTPIKAVTIDGNSTCRKYNIEAVANGNTRNTSGTACVGDDSAWHFVS